MQRTGTRNNDAGGRLESDCINTSVEWLLISNYNALTSLMMLPGFHYVETTTSVWTVAHSECEPIGSADSCRVTRTEPLGPQRINCISSREGYFTRILL